MESGITRVGDATPHGTGGGHRTWTVSLSENPSPEWKAAFRDPDDWTLTFHPRQVRIWMGTLIFESDDEDVPTWLQFIDRWIAWANGRLAAAR